MNTPEQAKIIISEDDAREIERSYDGLLERLKKLSAKTEIEAVSESIANLINFIIEKLSSEGGSLLLYISKIFDQDYIFAHSLNVCLISLRIGMKLELENDRLKDLGFLALVHASKDAGFPEGLLEKIKQDKELDEIIRLADVYDGQSHPPAYRHGIIPHETLASIIGAGKLFDPGLVKILLSELSLYPKGSWLQLCTGQIGKVISTNKEYPLRPVVKIFIEHMGEIEEKIIDLSKNNLIYVLRPVAAGEIKDIKES